jgi:hypothetical protein
MPETVFFKEGKIDFIVQNDRDWCLAQDVKTKYTLIEVNKKLPAIVQERRKDSVYLGVTKAAVRPQENKSKNYSAYNFCRSKRERFQS